MKIVFITNLYFPYSRGGAENIVQITANELAKLNYDVEIITTHPNWKSSVSIENKIKMFRFRPINIFYYLNDFKYNFFNRFIFKIIDTFNIFSAIKIFRYLKKTKPNFVFTHNLVGIGLLTSLVIKLLKIKQIHFLHDVQLVEPSGLIILNKEKTKNIIYKFLKIIYSKINIILFYKIDLIISPSNWLINFYTQNKFFKKNKKIVLQNPVLILDIIKIKNKLVENLNFTFVGQIEEHKGIIFLIESLNEIYLSLINKNFVLNIFGDGSIKNVLENKFKNLDFIKFYGKKDNQYILDFLKNKTDFLIVPSICMENLPTVIIESFSVSTPVIASNIGGIPELVINLKTGFLFESQNKEDFKRVIQIVQNLKNEEYSKLSQNTFLQIQKNNIDLYVKNLIKIIKEL